MTDGAVRVFYDGGIQPVIRYRLDPAPRGWVPQSDGWQMAQNSLTGLRLRVTNELIEVRGFGPFARMMRLFRLTLTLPTRETTVSTVPLSRFSVGLWRLPRWTADFVAFSWTRDDDSIYTLAVRPYDGDIHRLRDALRLAGATIS